MNLSLYMACLLISIFDRRRNVLFERLALTGGRLFFVNIQRNDIA